MTAIHAASRLRASQVYRYAMVNRPIGIGCCPKDGLVGSEDRPARGKPHYDMARNGVALYDRRLSDHETKSFEMAPMVDGPHEMAEYVAIVVKAFGKYGPQYLEMREESPEDFTEQVFDKLKSKCEGYMPSLGDPDAFVDLVAKALK